MMPGQNKVSINNVSETLSTLLKDAQHCRYSVTLLIGVYVLLHLQMLPT